MSTFINSLYSICNFQIGFLDIFLKTFTFFTHQVAHIWLSSHESVNGTLIFSFIGSHEFHYELSPIFCHVARVFIFWFHYSHLCIAIIFLWAQLFDYHLASIGRDDVAWFLWLSNISNFRYFYTSLIHYSVTTKTFFFLLSFLSHFTFFHCFHKSFVHWLGRVLQRHALRHSFLHSFIHFYLYSK